MSKIIAELWPKPEKGTSDIITEFTKLSKLDWNEIGPEETAIAAHKILKRIDDENIGKGMFAQVLTREIQNKNTPFIVPNYIKEAILWAASIDTEKDD